MIAGPANTSRADVIAAVMALKSKRWVQTLTQYQRLLLTHLVAPTHVELTEEGRREALALIEANDDALECYLDLREIYLKSKGVR